MSTTANMQTVEAATCLCARLARLDSDDLAVVEATLNVMLASGATVEGATTARPREW